MGQFPDWKGITRERRYLIRNKTGTVLEVCWQPDAGKEKQWVQLSDGAFDNKVGKWNSCFLRLAGEAEEIYTILPVEGAKLTVTYSVDHKLDVTMEPGLTTTDYNISDNAIAAAFYVCFFLLSAPSAAVDCRSWKDNLRSAVLATITSIACCPCICCCYGTLGFGFISVCIIDCCNDCGSKAPCLKNWCCCQEKGGKSGANVPGSAENGAPMQAPVGDHMEPVSASPPREEAETGAETEKSGKIGVNVSGSAEHGAPMQAPIVNRMESASALPKAEKAETGAEAERK